MILANIVEYFAQHKSYASRIKYLRDFFPTVFFQTAGKRQIQRVYDLINDITITPICNTCNENDVKFDTFESGYKRYCSHSCSVANISTVEKRKLTNLVKYGCAGSLGNPKVRQKMKSTMIAKYGVEHALQNSNILDQVLAKYKNKSAIEKQAITTKAKHTIQSLYGESMWGNPTIVNKRIATNRAKYGTDYVQQNDQVKQTSKISRTKVSFDKISSRLDGKFTPMFTATEFVGVASHVKYKWQCAVCSTIFKDHIDDGSNPICPTCNPHALTSGSAGEAEVCDFISSLGVSFIKNDRSIIAPKELDIYIPELQIAIEYCGLYWHSDKHVEKDYHLQKYKKCAEQGIRLITIFEDEWKTKQSICKSRLRHLLHSNTKSVHARQTTISEISGSIYKEFINLYHMQGYVPATIKLGAYFNDRLIGVMSFGAIRVISRQKSSSNRYELLRFASSIRSPGLASKMMKHFEKKYTPSAVTSYCDLRWGTGNMYLQLGFTHTHDSSPNYYYSEDGVKKFHRFNFTKSKLVNQGEDNNLTEREIMIRRGFYRIYDCGNAVFEKIYG